LAKTKQGYILELLEVQDEEQNGSADLRLGRLLQDALVLVRVQVGIQLVNGGLVQRQAQLQGRTEMRGGTGGLIKENEPNPWAAPRRLSAC